MMWLPDRDEPPIVDDWPPKPLSIYADIDYERMPRDEVRRAWLESVMSGAWDRAHPEFTTIGGNTVTDDQAKTPKPGDPEPAPPIEPTEPALEEADTTTTTTTTETTTEDPA